MADKPMIHLGYEVGTGEKVSIPVSHLCVTGQTQLSGKTTTMEALVSRSKLKAIAFVTKRGESAFSTQYDGMGFYQTLPIPPFFRHKADWQFVSEILGAVLNEKLKFERSWIMKVSRGAKSLVDVEKNVNTWLAKPKLRGLDESVLTTISEYFKLFMPELERLPFTEKLVLRAGLNVMDLSSYSTPLQMLVISAVVEEIYNRHKNVVTVIPEAWEFVPQGKNSPAKQACIALIRKGGGLQNFVWIDSQDLAGVEKVIVKSAGVFLLGVQREQNEVKRTLEHIPKVPAKLTVEDIMTLERGQFWVCFGNTVKKVYVQPAWMTEALAREVATGHTHTLPEFNARLRDVALGDSIVNINSPNTMGFRGIDYVQDETHPRDSITLMHPNDLPPIDRSEYGVLPGGVPFFIDSGGKTVDQQEREQYNETIAKLNKTITDLRSDVTRLERLAFPSKDSPERMVSYAGDEKKYGEMSEQEPVESIAVALLNHEPFISGLLSRLPTNGTVKVEAREVVLKDFQQQQVARLLADAASLTPWQRQVIRFMEARGTRATKKDIYTAIVGKAPQGGEGQMSRYKGVDELADSGYLYRDGGFFRGGLALMIKDRLQHYEATEQEIEDVVGQVMLKVK